MSSPLITKFRPQKWEDVLGQDAVIASLKKVITARSANSFIFSSEPGLGKGTISRILAKELECSDIWEINAADKNGVDDFRAILDWMEYGAFGATANKCCIIDECERLGAQVWSLLKKPVEEPPAHFFWIFNTNEESKIPKAILTRCPPYRLRPVHPDLIYNLLVHVCDAEQLDTPDEVLDLLSSKAKGVPRQALSWLAQCSACPDRKSAAEMIQTLVDDAEAGDLCRALAKGTDWFEAMSLLGKMEKASADSIKIAVVNYFSAVARGAKDTKAAIRACAMLDAFSKPSIGQGITPVILALGEVLLIQ